MVKTFASRLSVFILFFAFMPLHSWSEEQDSVQKYLTEIKPILENSCFICHAEGEKVGGISFYDYGSDEELLQDYKLWEKVLHNLRSGIMPPNPVFKPAPEDYPKIYQFIKFDVFKINPDEIDPGHVTLRRLNRHEYQNTIKDLMGVDYNSIAEFPPDDTGYGFDTIGDVLSVSPLLLEKYVQASETIVGRAVPTYTKVMPEQSYTGRQFKTENGEKNGDKMTFYDAIKVNRSFNAEQEGDYKVLLELEVDGSFDFDPGECRMIYRINGDERLNETYSWNDNKVFTYEFDETFNQGRQSLAFEVVPLVTKSKQLNKLDIEINSVKIQGPMDRKFWPNPNNYNRFFHRNEPPESSEDRRQYTREILQRFTTHAFRRPADDDWIDKLTAFAEEQYSLPGRTFEQGVAQALVTVLASPRFLFRFEDAQDEGRERPYPRIDEYALASRLSYFLWSTMPDPQLFELAEQGELRNQLRKQVERMVNDERSNELIQHFVGQWLQVRDIEHIPINVRKALGLPRRQRGEEEIEFKKTLRTAMRQETQMMFEYIMKNDRSVLEMLDSDYTFLNEELAEHYGIQGVEGNQMRKVDLAEDSPYGGVMTQGSILTVTSNPTRTSPVKRGLFIVENILGAPAPVAPPQVPDLEESEKEIKKSNQSPTMRELMELHRSQPMCASCHARFDPLGLALENFNAMGVWRDKENDRPIDASGVMITGESFQTIYDVKKIIVENHREEFYRSLTEKMLTYAIGRGLTFQDVYAIDQIVDRLKQENGRFSTLLYGVIESAPFQQRRNPAFADSHSS